MYYYRSVECDSRARRALKAIPPLIDIVLAIEGSSFCPYTRGAGDVRMCSVLCKMHTASLSGRQTPVSKQRHTRMLWNQACGCETVANPAIEMDSHNCLSSATPRRILYIASQPETSKKLRVVQSVALGGLSREELQSTAQR